MPDSAATTSNIHRSARDLMGPPRLPPPSRRKAPSLPVGGELPFAQRERVHLERFGQLRDVESDAKCRFITRPLDQRVRARDRTRRHVPDESLHIVERPERLTERAAGDAILARQRRIRYPIRDRPFGDLLIDPKPAGTGQIELDREIERDALLQSLLECRG